MCEKNSKPDSVFNKIVIPSLIIIKTYYEKLYSLSFHIGVSGFLIFTLTLLGQGREPIQTHKNTSYLHCKTIDKNIFPVSRATLGVECMHSINIFA